MARPLKEGMDYFPHDVTATGDKKIEALRALYGNDGYAFYFILLETIYQEPNFEIDISDAETIQILSRKVGINEEKFHQILSTAIKWKCFDVDEYEKRHVLTSRGIKKRAAVVTEKRDKMRSKYQLRVSDAETREETVPETTQSKSKRKDKEKKSNKDLISDFTDNVKLIQALKDFQTMRTRKRKPMTERALELLLGNLNKLAMGDDDLKIAILEQSIMQGWDGIYPLKTNDSRAAPSRSQQIIDLVNSYGQEDDP